MKEMNNCCCHCSERKEQKVIKIDYLYLDLKTCDRCVGTDVVLEEVINELTPAFALAGYSILYNKLEMKSEKEAIKNRFMSSPTIRVNGSDICDEVKESDCGCCGEISGTQVDCRVFEYEGQSYEVPPKAMLAESILKKAMNNQENHCCEHFELPKNLKNFFEGKKQKETCCCGGSCCC